MKRWHKVIAWGICACMIFEGVPVYGEGQDDQIQIEESLPQIEAEDAENNVQEVAVSTQSGEVKVWDSGTCGENAKWQLTSDGVFTILGSGPMKTYGYDYSDSVPTHPWSAYLKNIKKVVIEDGITTISPYSFYDSTNLTEVIIPDSVVQIGKDAFHGCKNITKVSIGNLESWCQMDFENANSNPIQFGADLYINGQKTTQIKIPDSITEIKQYTFARYGNEDDAMPITSIQLPETIEKIGTGAFFDNHLKNFEIPNSVKSIEAAALAGNFFRSINIPESVTSIGLSAFSECKELVQVEIPDSVKELGESIFYNCSKLTDVKLPQGIEAIPNEMFSGCTSLTKYEVPDTVKQIGSGAFSKCSSLSTINIPKSVTVIGAAAFMNCSSLKKVEIPAGVTQIKSATFEGCSALDNVMLPDTVAIIEREAFSGCISFSQIVIPDQVKTIGDSAFNGCTNLTEVQISDSAETIGDLAFADCSKLQKIIMPDNITSVGIRAFKDCSELKEVKLSESIKTIGNYCFQNCNKFSSLIIPANVTEVGKYSFDNCTALNVIYFLGDAPKIGEYAFNHIKATCYYPEGNETYTVNITSEDFGGDLIWTYEGEIKDQFVCGDHLTWNLTEDGVLTISGSGEMYDYSIDEKNYAPWYEQRKSITALQIDNNVTSIGDCAFYGCTMPTVSLPTNLKRIGNRAFESSSLTAVEIPEGVTEVGKEAFASNGSLKKVSLPSTLKSISEGMFRYSKYLFDVEFSTGLVTIEDYAFYSCYELNSVVIPEGVTSIGDYAFTGCGPSRSLGSDYYYSFKEVTLPESLTNLGRCAFLNCQYMQKINIPEGVTEIKDNTFSYCYNLSSITIPQNIKSIGEKAFNYSGISNVIFKWNAPSINATAFKEVRANCYYPSNNPEWTSNMFQNYSGNLTWIAQEMEKPPGEDGNDKDDSSGDNTGDNKGDNTGDNKGDNTGDNKGDNTGGNTGENGSESGNTDLLGFTAHSLTLDGEIGVNFYLELSKTIINDSSATMEMVVGGKNLTIIKVSDVVAAGTTPVTDSKGEKHNCYKFSCKINAKQMTDTVTATLKSRSGAWKEYYSVQQYANEANNGSNESLKNIVNAMLTYGAYAQKLFGYNTSNLAGGSLKDVSSVRNENLTKYQYQRSNSEDNLSLYGASLLLKEKTTIRVYYQLTSGNITDYEFKVDGQSVTPKKSGDDLYYIEAQDLAAQDLDQVHIFQGGSITVSNYSALSYVKTVLGYEKSTEDNKNAMSALYLYWDAAEKYFK